MVRDIDGTFLVQHDVCGIDFHAGTGKDPVDAGTILLRSFESIVCGVLIAVPLGSVPGVTQPQVDKDIMDFRVGGRCIEVARQEYGQWERCL